MKTILTIALILALNNVSFAQQGSRNSRQQMTPEQREEMLTVSAQRQTERMTEFLELNEEQQEAIHAINLKYAVLRVQITEAARTQEGMDIRTLLNELDERRDDEILPILNENQIDRFLEQKKEAQERREEMRQRVEERRRTGNLERQ